MKLRRPATPAVRPTLLIAGALGALWAAIIGLVIVAIPVYLAQLTTTAASAGWGATLHTSSAAWLVAHDVPIRIGGVTYSLLPWGLLAIPVVLLILAGRWASHVSHAKSRAERGLVIASAVVVYALLGLLASYVSADTNLATNALRSALTTGLISLLAFGWGVLRTRLAARRDELSPTRRVILRAGGLATVILIAVASVTFLIALAIGLPTAMEMQRALNAGPVGGLVLLLIGIGYLPMMLTWTIAYTAGSAVTIGAGSVISPFVATSVPTDLPPFPLLAALPAGSSTAQWFLPVLIVSAGVLVGIWISRRIVLPALKRAGVAAASAGIAALAVLLAAVMSNGSVGVDRLRDLGPAPLLTAVLVLALLCVGSIPVVLAFGRRPVRAIDETTVEASAPIGAESAAEPVAQGDGLPLAGETFAAPSVAAPSVIAPSSALDRSDTQIIELPRDPETSLE